MDDTPPFLRTPPFPGVEPATGAVSRRNGGGGARLSGRRLAEIATRIVEARIGGSFWAPPSPVLAPLVLRPGDRVRAAALLDRHDLHRVLVLLPDSGWGRRAGTRLAERGARVRVGETDPWSVLPFAERLEAEAGDEWRLIAALLGIPAPADGEAPPPTLAEALAGAIYRDPFTGASATLEATVERLAEWRETLDRNRAVGALAGIAWWKRDEVERMLWTGRDRRVRHYRAAAPAIAAAERAGAGIGVWPSRAPAGIEAGGTPLVRIEDGFIRSVGLGSALHPPMSIVADAAGIYYDPQAPSDLERLLAESDFPPALLDRAERLIAHVVAAGISKYAAGRGRYDRLPAGRRTVLVTGQVEDDLSVRRGGGPVTGNLDLLARVRAAEPDAFILFKPHPDVEAGHRAGRIDDAAALAYADAVEREAAMPALLDAVDAVHVWTSLAGFEALLRGREVTTHGHPFYAGWGLTRDLAGPLPRRGRRLALAELVAATLILYPRYLDPVTNLPCPPEILIARLTGPSFARRSLLRKLRHWQGRLRTRLPGPRRR